jgi:hypothetical protein
MPSAPKLARGLGESSAVSALARTFRLAQAGRPSFIRVAEIARQFGLDRRHFEP